MSWNTFKYIFSNFNRCLPAFWTVSIITDGLCFYLKVYDQGIQTKFVLQIFLSTATQPQNHNPIFMILLWKRSLADPLVSFESKIIGLEKFWGELKKILPSQRSISTPSLIPVVIQNLSQKACRVFPRSLLAPL